GFYDALTPVPDNVTEMLATLPDNAALARRWGMPRFLMDLRGFQLHYTHLLMPTCTVTTITSKPAETGATLPTQATASVDFQLVPEQDPYTIFVRLREHLDERGFHDVQARTLSASRPTVTASDHPFVQSVAHATEAAYEQTPYLLPMTVGSYALHPLRMRSDMPIVLVARNRQSGRAAFAAIIKQLAAILLEGTAYSC
ncbi:MAG TPA: hypothetical protein VEL31_03125, partial [Ktedonobacteraceae bacterium]|nr:hypothetical protein [Ktedonobacteraceae bacterium]